MAYKVIVERQCGCFKKSGDEAVRQFDNKDDALMEANSWKDEMNDTYCKKHIFSVLESGDDFMITMEMNR